MPTWIVLALTAASFWGTAQVFIKKGYDNISPLWNNIFANLISLFVWIPVSLHLSRGQINPPSISTFVIIFVAASLYMFYVYALSKGQVSLTSTIMSTYPIFTIILSSVFLKENLTLNQLFGIVLILTGVIIIGLPEEKMPKSIKNLSWLAWGLGFAFFSGTGDFLSKIAVNQIGAYSQIFYLTLSFQILSIVNYLVDKKGRKLPKLSGRKFLPTLLGNTLLVSGTLCYFLAFDYGKASLIAPLSSIYQVITIILAVIFLKEKISLKQALGIGGIIIGVVIIGANAG